ncbi:hypothetical protein ACVI1N_000467 [Sinorhizobium medicae]
MLANAPREQRSAKVSAHLLPASPSRKEKNGGAAAKARLSGRPRRATTVPYSADEKKTNGIVARLTDIAPLERP